jgi:hypothetical protein
MRADLPGYWMNETSGKLRPAIFAYLNGQRLTEEHAAAIRAYLRQWMAADWKGPEIASLRAAIDAIRNGGDVERWLTRAIMQGIDPL